MTAGSTSILFKTAERPNPAAFSSRFSVAHDGLVSPSSIRATTDWAVRAFRASARCDSPERSRALESSSAGPPGVDIANDS